jgi:hypothetical protein
LAFKIIQIFIEYFFNISKNSSRIKLKLLRKYYFYWLKISSKFKLFKIKNLKNIDILIPIHPKDVYLIELVINAAKKCSLNPISNIYIVSNLNEIIVDICNANGYIFINEDTIESILPKNKINYTFEGINRSGWLFQQLIKLSADTICSEPYVLVLDADTILTQKQVFVSNKLHINCSDELHLPYFRVLKKILSIDKVFPLSFVSHYMIFEKNLLKKMKNEIERIHSENWINVVLKEFDKNNISGFSEYEMWGNFLVKFHCCEIYLSYWNNFSLNYIPSDFSEFEENYRMFKSVSIHEYNVIK